MSTIDKQNKESRSVKVADLRRYWNRLFGFSPNLTVKYVSNGKQDYAHFYGLRGHPTWNVKEKSLSFQVVVTAENSVAYNRINDGLAKISGITIKPTPSDDLMAKSNMNSAKDARGLQARSTSSTCSSLSPSVANTTFCVPYATELGSGGSSWVNILSSTMQTINTSCMGSIIPSQIAGNAETAGTIDIYETAAEVNTALSVGGSVGYSGVADISLSASYSTTATTDTNSFYAVATVNWNGGFVNFGTPSLNGTTYGEASDIGSFTDAISFISYCGDSVPLGYSVGASWASVLQITAETTSDAQTLSSSMSASYAGASASANFSSDLSTQTSSVNITETDECWGPANCFSVSANGMSYETVTSSDETTALAGFTQNYTVMLEGLPNACNPGPTDSSCVTSVNYGPIYPYLPTSFSGPSPSEFVSEASQGVYGVLSNLNSWVTGYQSLQTGNPSSPDLSSWDTDQTNLTNQAKDCALADLTNTSCVNAFNGCFQSLSTNSSYTNNACLPSSAFETNTALTGLPNPWTIQLD